MVCFCRELANGGRQVVEVNGTTVSITNIKVSLFTNIKVSLFTNIKVIFFTNINVILFTNINVTFFTNIKVSLITNIKVCSPTLTHYCLKPFSSQILRSSLSKANIVYRFIDAALIGFFPWSLLLLKTKFWLYGNYSCRWAVMG